MYVTVFRERKIKEKWACLEFDTEFSTQCITIELPYEFVQNPDREGYTILEVPVIKAVTDSWIGEGSLFFTDHLQLSRSGQEALFL